MNFALPLVLALYTHYRTHLGFFFFFRFGAGTKGCLHLQWVILPSSINKIKATSSSGPSQCNITARLISEESHKPQQQALSSRDVSISAVKTDFAVIVGPFSLTHCSSSHRASSTFSSLPIHCPCLCFALLCFAAVLFTHKPDTP